MKTRLALLTVASVMLAALSLDAQQRSSVPTLTPEDYAEIQQLYARYAHGIDHALEDNAERLINVYTPDGAFVNQTLNRTEGRDRLRTFGAGNRNSGRGRLNIQHLTWNVIIEPAPWGAYGRAYLSTARRPSEDKTIILGEGGIYYDTIVKTAEGWRFKKRQFVKDWPRLPRGTPPAPSRPATQ